MRGRAGDRAVLIIDVNALRVGRGCISGCRGMGCRRTHCFFCFVHVPNGTGGYLG